MQQNKRMVANGSQLSKTDDESQRTSMLRAQHVYHKNQWLPALRWLPGHVMCWCVRRHQGTFEEILYYEKI